MSVALDLARTTPRLASWAPPKDAQGLPYVELGSLAATVSLVDSGDDSTDWSPLFAEIEHRLTRRPDERNVIALGFLETLQNVELNSARDLARWEPILGPETRSIWVALVAMWAGRIGRDAFLATVGGA